MPEQGQRGVVARPPGEGRGNRLTLGFGVFELAVGLVVQAGHAIGIDPLIIQRAAQVEGRAFLVERAVLHADFMERRVQRPLADHVDHTARAGLAVEHRRWAAQHVHALKVERILLW
ncbi:hypothetical protein D3C73_1362320 [compost metagenome]